MSKTRTVSLVAGESPTPGRCFICNSQDRVVTMRRQFRWAPKWVYLGLIVTILLAVILEGAMQRTATVEMPTCGRCRRRWFWSELGFMVVSVASFIAVVTAPFIAAESLQQSVGILAGSLLLGFLWVVLMLGAREVLLAPNQVRCISISRQHQLVLQVPSRSSVAPPMGTA